MNISLLQLPQRLRDHPPIPHLCLSGDDPLLLNDAWDAIRATLPAERTVRTYWVDASFDWRLFFQEVQQQDIFSPQPVSRLICTQLPNAAAQASLNDFFKSPCDPNEHLIALQCPPLKAEHQRQPWWMHLNAHGWCLPIWPLKPAEFITYLTQHAQRLSLNLSAPSLQRIAQHSEGHPFAARQWLEQLALLHTPSSSKTAEQWLPELLSTESRYEVFEWIEQLFLKNKTKAFDILQRLRQEDVEPSWMFAALTREMFTVFHLLETHLTAPQTPWSMLLTQAKIPAFKHRHYQAVLPKWSVESLEPWFTHLTLCEQAFKSNALDLFWEQLEQCTALLWR